ncbi:MAG: hypothetical protein ACREBJ_12260 [Nitrosotalea sp.]
MDFKLKLDFDHRHIKKQWSMNIWRIYRIYSYKRDYLPYIHVEKVTETRKGIHVIVRFVDKEKCRTEREYKLITLIWQGVLESDNTRTGFDLLRILKGDKTFNLLFGYKSGKKAADNGKLKNDLNLRKSRIKIKFENLKIKYM